MFAHGRIFGSRPRTKAHDTQPKYALLTCLWFHTLIHNFDHVSYSLEDILGTVLNVFESLSVAGMVGIVECQRLVCPTNL